MAPVKKRPRQIWDFEKWRSLRAAQIRDLESVSQSGFSTFRLGRCEVFRLQGKCVFDPAHLTSENVREFMWAGLRLLKAQAKARGLAEDEVQKLLMDAFFVFHDAAESVWTALRTVVSNK